MADKSETRRGETEEREAPKAKKLSLVEHFTAVVEGFEAQETPFSPEASAAVQSLSKRLSRTLGAYRAPAE